MNIVRDSGISWPLLPIFGRSLQSTERFLSRQYKNPSFFISKCTSSGKIASFSSRTKTERQRDREGETERERETDTKRDGGRDRQRGRGRGRERQREKKRENER